MRLKRVHFQLTNGHREGSSGSYVPEAVREWYLRPPPTGHLISRTRTVSTTTPNMIGGRSALVRVDPNRARLSMRAGLHAGPQVDSG